MSSSIITTKGSIKKQVQCENCGNNYDYLMKRTAAGQISDSKLTKAEAADQATQKAAAKLKDMLEKECDLVPCPACGSITNEMRKARLAFFPKILFLAGAGAGLLLLVLLAWLILGRVFIVAGVIGAGVFALGCMILIAKSFQMLLPGRRQISLQ